MKRLPSTFEETLVLTDNDEENVFNVGCAIQRGSTWIHKYTMKGGGQFLIVEGVIATKYTLSQPGWNDRTLNNRYQVVIVNDGLYKNCITVVRRGEYMKYTLTKPKKVDLGWDGVDVTIPEIKLTPTKTRRKDFVYTIHLERNTDEQHVQDNDAKSVA